MKLIMFASACLCLLMSVSAWGRAQGDLQESKGAFVTSIGGREVARESYTFAPEPDGTLRAEAEVSNAGGAKQKLVTVATRAHPQSFTAEAGGAQIYSATLADSVVKVHALTQPDTELQTRASVVLENLVWHQFHFLFAQYDAARGGVQTFTFFVPSAGKDFEITVERVDSPAYTVKGQRLQTEHFRMVANKSLNLEAWVGAGRVPLLFNVAAQQVRGVRVGMEELEKAALAPSQKAAEYQPPAYAAPSSFTEKDVTVGAGTEWALPGTLTMPVGKGTFPAVVLVHGSGPNDRDETLLANKPFRDLAWGLASQGIAVVRYDKRTRVYGAKVAALGNFTVKEESVDDAVAAAQLLRQTPGVDPARVFVLGHSLGAGLAPRIAAADPLLRGVVVLAGPTTPLEDTIVRQYEYLLSLDGTLTDDERKFIEDARRQTARIRQLTKADLGSSELLHGAPAAYWLDLRAYDARATALKLKQPMLVLQGERDYNVTMTDFAGWQRLAARRKNVETKSYPKLDHLFLEGEGPSSDAQYAAPRNIPRYVIDDIAAFIKRH
ncbi:MAG: alpha/beta hydrolase family protein [Pyrinomonadaceae bacterium]